MKKQEVFSGIGIQAVAPPVLTPFQTYLIVFTLFGLIVVITEAAFIIPKIPAKLDADVYTAKSQSLEAVAQTNIADSLKELKSQGREQLLAIQAIGRETMLERQDLDWAAETALSKPKRGRPPLPRPYILHE